MRCPQRRCSFLWEKRDAFYATLSAAEHASPSPRVDQRSAKLFLDDRRGLTTGPARIRDMIEELRAEKRTLIRRITRGSRAPLRSGRHHRNGVIIRPCRRGIAGKKSATQSAIEANLTHRCANAPCRILPTDQQLGGGRRTQLTVQSSRPARTLVELVTWVEGQGTKGRMCI